MAGETQGTRHESKPIQPSTLPNKDEDHRVRRLRELVAPHVESFNFAMSQGLEVLPEMIEPVSTRVPNGVTDDTESKVELRYSAFGLVKPRVGSGSGSVVEQSVFPTECRRGGLTYGGDFFADFVIMIDGIPLEIRSRRLGRIPIMVCSEKCNAGGMSPAQLIEAGEEQYELGGYFILNGSEKALRMIVVPRANSVISVKRDANKNRGPQYTAFSVSIRCMRDDLSTTTMHMHYLRNGGANVRINLQDRAEYFLPVGVLLRALLPSGTTAREIFDRIVGGDTKNAALRASALAIARDLDEWSIKFEPSVHDKGTHPSMSQYSALEFLGQKFKAELRLDDSVPDHEAGVTLLRRGLLVHLSTSALQGREEEAYPYKADMLIHMLRKLVACANDEIEVDDQDATSHQEILLPGQLYLNYLKDRLETLLQSTAAQIRRSGLNSAAAISSGRLTVDALVQQSIAKLASSDLIGQSMNYFLATGNIRSRSGLDLPQTAGYSIMAERINFLRFIMHFRCIHRGAFYSTMRSTKVRKLLPEGWGFICPVQTPDGAPCGLLNHLGHTVRLSQGHTRTRDDIDMTIAGLGVDPAPGCSALHPVSGGDKVPVLVDGRVVGFVDVSRASEVVDMLRSLKTRAAVPSVAQDAEIVLVPKNEYRGCGFYPGIYIHTTPGRMVRPVLWLAERAKKKRASSSGSTRSGTVEYIGTLEQVFLQVRPALPDAKDSLSPVSQAGATHMELDSTNFVSEVAAMTPFFDMNQGPRNIFQCQMAKQAMGTPCHRYSSRYDAKVYRLLYPQAPITRNMCMQDPLGADLFPNGLNGVVAVISYTGQDMEDALILNKGSVDRGYAHGMVYANKRIDLESSAQGRSEQFAALTPKMLARNPTVDSDGLPAVGARLQFEDRLYATGPFGASAAQNEKQYNKLHWTEHKSADPVVVDEVQVINRAAYAREPKRQSVGTIREVSIRTRTMRKPSVGDKFATRAGQKGTVAALWPAADMPFSESGIVPDVLFNPNGFPSRMTIGMMVEQLSGKVGALKGKFQDSTPFRFDERCRAVDYFAEELARAGYNYYGNETLYSGYTGEPFEVEIFMGIIHYQRLRHMVSDKFQVRSKGKVHPLYRQPIQGRKRGGAIRFGEMERDGLLAHGASFLLRDRLATASDLHVLHVCEDCGSLLGPIVGRPSSAVDTANAAGSPTVSCRLCAEKSDSVGFEDSRRGARGSNVHRVAMPYSFKYLVNELAAMNIRTVIELRQQ